MSDSSLGRADVNRDVLAERALQSTEFALKAARRRLAEEGETIDALTRHVAELEAALERARAAPEPLRARLVATERALRRAEQLAHSERLQREELADEVVRVSTLRIPLEGAERELVQAQSQVRRLEAELEIVVRGASEFEHSAAIAIGAMWRELGAVKSMSRSMSEELDQLRLAVRGEALPPPPDEPQPIGEQFEPERFEQALSRLRERMPEERPPGRLGRWLRRVARRLGR